MNLSLETNKWTDVAHHLDTFTKEASDILAFKKTKGVLPDSFAHKFPLHMPELEPGKKSPDRRTSLHGASFELPGTFGDDDAVSPPPAAETLKCEASPEKDENKLPKPIIVAPDRLEFKQALAVCTLLSVLTCTCHCTSPCTDACSIRVCTCLCAR